MLKLASWNVNSLKVRLPHLLDWLAAQQPDILGLQETKTIDDNFPLEAIEAAGYHLHFAGQKTYNGVALLSKTPISDIVTDLPGLEDPQRRVLGATVQHPGGAVRFLNLYVPNGSEVGSEKYAYKLAWLAALEKYIAAQLAEHERLVVVGDFNITPDDRDLWDPVGWKDKILASPLERAALQRLLDLGLSDTFRLFEQEPETYSWWDYRAAGFRRNHGMRIDLLLSSPAMSRRCTASYVDREPRKLERPSDHAPVVAEFKL
ncbi:MAG: exodeoxyribonuclease III [Gammaproteobacteria bacterium]|nr:exodeoxyribonuclease III [Gammaproteobacteria bacterium]